MELIEDAGDLLEYVRSYGYWWGNEAGEESVKEDENFIHLTLDAEGYREKFDEMAYDLKADIFGEKPGGDYFLAIRKS